MPTDDLHRLRTALAVRTPAAAADLAGALGVSVPTLHRLLQRLPPGELVGAGKARRARYALRRPLHAGRGVLADLPVYAITPEGQAELLAPLAALQGGGCWMPLAGSGWPVPDEARDGWWPGLPYPLYDMRPQGYMGRLFARAEHRALGVAPDPQAWSDDDVLHVLSLRGSDTSGCWIVGNDAYALWQTQRQALPPPFTPQATAAAYAQLADEAVASGVPGSSAAGEFPKVAARRNLPPGTASGTPHVLVKFSGADAASPTVQRWSDLLVCEHLALEHAARLPGVQTATSRILQHGGRTFLEVERFDRRGEHGRSPLCSMETANATLLGAPSRDWTVLATRLVAQDWLAPEDAQRIAHLGWFGRLIANTDMHLGNLALRPMQGRLALAPAYDMLPMLHAPLPGGEVPVRAFEPPLPLPQQREVWHAAWGAARDFWQAAEGDKRISAGFREVCAEHAERLSAAAEHA